MYEDRLVRTGVLRPTPPRRRRRRPGIPLVLAAFGLAALGFAAFVDPAPRLVWNASASAPIGLYWADHVVPARGDFVLAELPPRAQRLAAERSYLPKGVPLVKRVAALAGDTVCVIGATVFINGQPVAEQSAKDHRGRPLPRWSDCRRLADDEVFLLMADVPDSFDGRYFGPVPRTSILGTLIPLWTGSPPGE